MSSTAFAPQLPATRSARPVRAVRPARPAPRAQGSLRLTRRGRLVVLVLGLVAMLALGVVLGSVSAASDESTAGQTETIRVQSGDTLWDIAAARAGSGESVQDVIDEIRSINHLSSGALMAGDQLEVPAAG
ncbi:LysM peptidoglycan-binding domain-containing protein [Nocardioides zeae]|uniref:Tfp pilus assembly protein FimV n=1 Tax=Nocardioides zeae TaxID=1457234 RepID=A0AAJ1WZH9_9ACTN|nr:LysM peptidoglycan-binding domain-containing protein [Nocardioides zeae]MDQ1102726.1 Tfp pilus assembly protein FimV [Nocardioides zeae]